MNITKIVSGGQTAWIEEPWTRHVREACKSLDGFREDGLRNGPIQDEYPMSETETASYDERTRLNVRDSDGTLIISHGPLSGGSHLTRAVAVNWAGRICTLMSRSNHGLIASTQPQCGRPDIASRCSTSLGRDRANMRAPIEARTKSSLGC